MGWASLENDELWLRCETRVWKHRRVNVVWRRTCWYEENRNNEARDKELTLWMFSESRCACVASCMRHKSINMYATFLHSEPAWPERKSAAMTSGCLAVNGSKETRRINELEDRKLISNQMRLKNRSGNQQQRRRTRLMRHANALTKPSPINTTYNLHIFTAALSKISMPL